jgi:hypothetical protein
MVLLGGCTSGGSVGGGTTTTVPATSPTTSEMTEASSAAQACRGSALEVSLGSSEGLGGTSYTPLILKNRSSSGCALTGYPEVSFLDGSGQVIGQAASTGEEAVAVTLAPDEVGSADIGVTSISLGTCRRLTPASVRVVLPEGGAVSVAAGDFAFCPGENPTIGAFRN